MKTLRSGFARRLGAALLNRLHEARIQCVSHRHRVIAQQPVDRRLFRLVW